MAMIAIMLTYASVTAILLLRSQASARKFSALSWEELRLQLAPVDQEELSTARLQYLKRMSSQLKPGEAKLTSRFGRKENIRRIKKNSLVVVALAGYCDGWRRDAPATVANEVRDHAAKVGRAITCYQVTVFLQMEQQQKDKQLELIAYEYLAMTACLLSLYQQTHIARYRQVRVACS